MTDIKIIDVEKCMQKTRNAVKNRLIANNISRRVIRSIMDDIDHYVSFCIAHAFEQEGVSNWDRVIR